jgi:endonuclease/exonuclease/phosphatase family metal-dependent hydrolase
MRELLAQAPTLICLQEVTPRTLPTIQSLLGGRYLDVEGAGFPIPNRVYFTKMFLLRAAGLTLRDFSRRAFDAGSGMGRDLLLATLSSSKGIRVCVATSHLESLASNVDLRQLQLTESLHKIEACSHQQGAGLFLLVGDLNVSSNDEPRLKNLTKPPHGWTDALASLPKNITWDARTNKRVQVMTRKNDFGCRFDRCFFKIRGGQGGQAQGDRGWIFRGGSLVGTSTHFDQLKHGHASDHYGLGLVWEHPSAFGDSLGDGKNSAAGYVLGGGDGEASAASRGRRDGESNVGRGGGRTIEDERQMRLMAAQVCRWGKLS